MTPPRGNKPLEIVLPELMAAQFAEQKKTNALLQKLVLELEAEGTAEKLGKMLDGRKGKRK